MNSLLEEGNCSKIEEEVKTEEEVKQEGENRNQNSRKRANLCFHLFQTLPNWTQQPTCL